MESKLIPLTWHLQASVLPAPTSSQSRSIPPASEAKNSSSFLSALRPHSSPNHPQILLQSLKATAVSGPHCCRFYSNSSIRIMRQTNTNQHQLQPQPQPYENILK